MATYRTTDADHAESRLHRKSCKHVGTRFGAAAGNPLQGMEAIMTESGDKPIGSVMTYLRKLNQSVRSKQVDVPCGSCTACCRSPHMPADLLPQERADFPDAVPMPVGMGGPRSSGWALPKRPDGSCVYLIDDKCSIYHRRPDSC